MHPGRGNGNAYDRHMECVESGRRREACRRATSSILRLAVWTASEPRRHTTSRPPRWGKADGPWESIATDGIDAPICQDKRLGCLRDVSAHAEVCHNTLVDFTGEEAFEAADDLASGQATTHRHPPVSLNDPDRHRDDAHSQVEVKVSE